MARDREGRRLLTAAGASAVVLVLSIVIAVVLGELPSVLWLFVVPIGMFGAGVVCVASIGMVLARRA